MNIKYGRKIHHFCIYLSINKNRYDLVITHALEWPSLTCQWYPGKILYN